MLPHIIHLPDQHVLPMWLPQAAPCGRAYSRECKKWILVLLVLEPSEQTTDPGAIRPSSTANGGQ
jgi:hypothetical protein